MTDNSSPPSSRQPGDSPAWDRMPFADPRILPHLMASITPGLPPPSLPIRYEVEDMMENTHSASRKRPAWMRWSRLEAEQHRLILRLFWHPDFKLHLIVVAPNISVLRKARSQSLANFIVGEDYKRRASCRWLDELQTYWEDTLDDISRKTLIEKAGHLTDPTPEERAQQEREEEAAFSSSHHSRRSSRHPAPPSRHNPARESSKRRRTTEGVDGEGEGEDDDNEPSQEQEEEEKEEKDDDGRTSSSHPRRSRFPAIYPLPDPLPIIDMAGFQRAADLYVEVVARMKEMEKQRKAIAKLLKEFLPDDK